MVQQAMALIAAAPSTDTLKTNFAVIINNFIAEVAPTAQVTVAVAACSAPVVEQGVAVARYSTDFSDGNDDGWTCGAVQQCGSYGNVCGGHNQKASGLAAIEKAIPVHQPGYYKLELSFLKVDSW